MLIRQIWGWETMHSLWVLCNLQLMDFIFLRAQESKRTAFDGTWMSHELSFRPSVLMRAKPYPQYALFLHCLCLLLPKSNLNHQVSTKAMFRSDKDSLRGEAACVQGDCLSGVFLTTRRGCPHAAPQSHSLYSLPPARYWQWLSPIGTAV